jgi:hypothetical protein
MKRKKLLFATFLITNVFLNSDSFAQGQCPDAPPPEKTPRTLLGMAQNMSVKLKMANRMALVI